MPETRNLHQIYIVTVNLRDDVSKNVPNHFWAVYRHLRIWLGTFPLVLILAYYLYFISVYHTLIIFQV